MTPPCAPVSSTPAFDIVDTPIGPLLVAVDRPRACCASRSATVRAGARRWRRSRVSPAPRVLRAPTAVDDGPPRARRVLRGSPTRVRPRDRPPRAGAVHRLRARRAREGPVRPHGDLRRAGRRAPGSPKAARAVGMVMNRNPVPIVLPCHRIVGASGSLVGYAGGLDIKEHSCGWRASSSDGGACHSRSL